MTVLRIITNSAMRAFVLYSKCSIIGRVPDRIAEARHRRVSSDLAPWAVLKLSLFELGERDASAYVRRVHRVHRLQVAGCVCPREGFETGAEPRIVRNR
jgi:hypothetical protein